MGLSDANTRQVSLRQVTLHSYIQLKLFFASVDSTGSYYPKMTFFQKYLYIGKRRQVKMQTHFLQYLCSNPNLDRAFSQNYGRNWEGSRHLGRKWGHLGGYREFREVFYIVRKVVGIWVD